MHINKKNENLEFSKLNQDRHGVLNIRFIARFGAVNIKNDVTVTVYSTQVGFNQFM